MTWSSELDARLRLVLSCGQSFGPGTKTMKLHRAQLVRCAEELGPHSQHVLKQMLRGKQKPKAAVRHVPTLAKLAPGVAGQTSSLPVTLPRAAAQPRRLEPTRAAQGGRDHSSGRRSSQVQP
jgi:hypothetical protein